MIRATAPIRPAATPWPPTPKTGGTATYALGAVDKVRIRVTPSDPSAPVFVGMARPDDEQRYLGTVTYLTAHGASGYRVSYTKHDGQAPATPPAHAIPWTVQATGRGTQTLEFDAQELRGDQVVVMNADGSPWARGADNHRARALGWTPRYPSWRDGFAALRDTARPDAR